ncbi:ribosome production factor 1-like isoform X1 [Tubulanus polymorphus]|uniref:ribosome production factor 1-like isoform X1 n=1 Tax=Tubulanus polymorphus TaxID=672921 RepID=UPI003DA49E57
MADKAVEGCVPKTNISQIKNKQRRTAAYLEMKREQRKQKKKQKKLQKEERKALGDNAPPKQVPKTIENCRVYDETFVNPEDEEVAVDEANDELAPYFNRETTPKILIVASDRSSRGRTDCFCKELKRIIPNSVVKYRRGLALKKIIEQCKGCEYTDLLVVNQNRGIPNGLVISHLPDGPTAHFKVSNVKLVGDLKKMGSMSCHHPEVILNNFNTHLGHRIGRLMASLFPHSPQFEGRRVVTFHNQRDFIFFRQHRYEFRNSQKVGLKELGPRFTLKLRSLQKGTFDSKFGEYEWVHKRHEMETSRRKFFL